jgi:hypothetical protein
MIAASLRSASARAPIHTRTSRGFSNSSAPESSAVTTAAWFPRARPRSVIYAPRGRWSRLRAILKPKLLAAREAGFENMSASNVARLDRRPDIRARVAALSKMDEEIVRMRRERIEARLMMAKAANILRDFA